LRKSSPPSRSRSRVTGPPQAKCTDSPHPALTRQAMSSSAQSARDLSKRHKHSAVICRSHTLAIHLISLGSSCDARSVRLTESATSGPRSYTFLCTARQNFISATSSTLSKICWERQIIQRIAWSIRERIPPTLW
jgi:hypothetical protein